MKPEIETLKKQKSFQKKFAMNSPILKLEKIRKTFPGMIALDDIDFELNPGEIHALLGENGAGKSTLIKLITGFYQRDSGTQHLNNVAVEFNNPRDAQSAGISTVYQEVNLLPNLSVAENLFLGREPRKFGFIQWREINSRAQELLKTFSLDLDVRKPLNHYSTAIAQLIAIARALDQNAKILILDEPTASLDQTECERLFAVMKNLAASGVAIVFVTHFLDQVYQVCDRITVLRNGKHICTNTVAELPREKLVEQMLGRTLEAHQPHQYKDGQHKNEHEKTENESIFLRATQLSANNGIHNLSFDLARGQATGLSGLLGSGRSETCNALFGLNTVTQGHLEINSQATEISSVRRAMSLGLALCPEDRKTQSILGPLSIRENLIIALQTKRGWWRKMSRAEQEELARNAIQQLRIATTDMEKPIEALSGGNQQKVILARWLITQPNLLILDEPTRGIDIGAHADLINAIRELRDGGMSLLVASSEIEELVAFSDQILVLNNRQLIARLSNSEISADAILGALAKGTAFTKGAAA